jgi:hypothetical protein
MGQPKQVDCPKWKQQQDQDNRKAREEQMEQRKFNLDDYETVETRLEKFWTKYPNGQVLTELVSHDSSYFIVKAKILADRDNGRPIASGYAHEVQGVGMVNKTSALENCETSAIGRALANAGFATKGKRASREEMAKVERGTKVETKVKPARTGDVADVALAEAYIEVGIAENSEKLKKIWADNSDILDVEYNGTTLRAYIMQRKDEVTK